MSGKSPQKEPDYTAQRADFAAAESANRQQQASGYNAVVQAYNDELRKNLSGLNSFGSSLDNLSIRDVDQFDSYENKLNSWENSLANHSFDHATPTWSSSVQSPYGAVTVDVPNLLEIDNSARNQYETKLLDLSGNLDNLRQAREAEEDRISDFRTGLLGELGSINNQLEDLSIADSGQIAALSSALGDIDTRRNTFSSEILDQIYPTGFSTVASQYTLANSALDNLRAEREAEQERITDFRDTLRSGYDNLSGQFSDLTIRDEQGIEDLQSLIDQRQLEASRFDSELDFDFTSSLNNFQNLEDNLSALRADRNNELARVDSAEEAARAAAYNLETSLDSTDIYDLTRLNSLMRQIDAGQQDLTDFTSDLDFDFSDELTRFSDVDASLNSLLTRRNEVLGGYGDDIANILGTVSAAELYDQDTFDTAIGDLGDLQATLGRFSGTDSNELGYTLEDALSTAQGRLEDLGQFRDDFETDLQSELDALNSTSFYEFEDFNPFDTRSAELQELLDTYGATQASDELAAYNSRIASERSRLQTERLSDGSATLTTQDQIQDLLGAVTSGAMTPEQYLAILAGIEEEEQSGLGNSGFSGNILRL